MSDRGGDNNIFFFAKREGFQIRKMYLNKKDASTQTEDYILYMMDNSVKTEIWSPKQDSDDMMDDSVDCAQELGAYTQEVASDQKDQMSDIGYKSVEDDSKPCTSTGDERSRSPLKEETNTQREYAKSTSPEIEHCILHCRCNIEVSSNIFLEFV